MKNPVSIGVFSICLFIVSQVSTASVNDGLVAYYPFNGNASDESGNGHDGAVYGATPIADRFGNADSAYDFDGVNDRIDLPDAVLEFERTDSFSMSLWIKTDDADTRNNIIAKMTSSVDARGINIVVANGLLRFQLINHNTGGNGIRVDGTTVLSDNQWHHIAVTYDGSSTAVGAKIYIDGKPESMTVVRDTLTGTILNNQIPTIGSRNTAYGYYYEGAIDDVRIFNRVLTEEEISESFSDGNAELYVYSDILTNTLVATGESVTKFLTISNAGGANLDFSFCPPDISDNDGLVAYYPFNGNANDESVNGYDGVVYGATLIPDRLGNANSAYQFDGYNDRIDLPTDTLDFERTNAFSLALWIKTTDTDNANNIIAKKELSGRERGLNLVLASGFFRFQLISQGAIDRMIVRTEATVNDGQWHHLVATYDGSSSADGVSLYLDGIPTGMYVGVDTLTGAILNTVTPTIGSRNNAYYYKGAIDEFRIYNRVITADEVAALYTENSDDLVAYYPFNGNANDESGNGHDGMVNGAMLTEDRFGNVDSAYHFDGLDDLVMVPNDEDFIMSDVSVVAWIRTTDDSQMRHITSCYGTGFYSEWYNLYVRKDSGVASWQVDPGGTTVPPPRVDSVAAVTDGMWHCLVGVRDTSISQLRMYVDGVLVNMSSDVSTEVLNPEVDFWIGGQNGFPLRYFNGDIDDVRIYNRTLSESEISDIYMDSESEQCALPDWLSVEPKAGTIALDAGMDVAITFNASNMVAGDYAEYVLQLQSNDPEYPVVEAPVSMWVVPSVPEIDAEPLCTLGRENLITWTYQDGSVEYRIEAMSVQHYAPTAREGNGSLPPGWENQNRYNQKLDCWSKDSGWISSTYYLFDELRLNTIYMYRVKASVMTDIGRLEGEWSDWVLSCQVPVLPKAD